MKIYSCKYHFWWILYHINESKVSVATSDPAQSSGRRISFFKDLSTLLIFWKKSIIKSKSFVLVKHYLCWKSKIYTGYYSQWSQCTNYSKEQNVLELFISWTLFSSLCASCCVPVYIFLAVATTSVVVIRIVHFWNYHLPDDQ